MQIRISIKWDIRNTQKTEGSELIKRIFADSDEAYKGNNSKTNSVGELVERYTSRTGIIFLFLYFFFFVSSMMQNNNNYIAIDPGKKYILLDL